jgi:dCTP diphosphatase
VTASDSESTIEALKNLVRDFSRRRDWEQFHHPKDLGVALAIEVGELLEHFRYQTDEQIGERLSDGDAKRELAHEMADCFWLLLRLADVCGVDMAASLQEKVALAELKYPIDQVKGKPHKYTHYLPRSKGE